MNDKYKNLMSPLKIGGMTVKNRYAVAPMGSPALSGSRGEHNRDALAYYTERARGGFGLIVTGNIVADMEVQKPNLVEGPIPPSHAPSIWRESSLRLTRRVHAYGTKILMQIGFGHGRMRPGQKTPSPIPRYGNPSEITQALTREEIETKIGYMIKTAKLAQGAGFDGVEIHAMHWGYLLDQFAMSISNFRTDEFGGDLEGRMTVARRIIQGIRAACGKDFVISMRLGMKSYIRGFEQDSLFGEEEAGRTLEEACEIARLLEKYGCDMLNVNAGIYDSFYYCVSPAYLPKCFNLELAKEVKKAVSIPVFTAGRMDDPDRCEKAVADGETDGISLGRASLAEPHYARKVQMGCPEKIRPCISCGNCMRTLFADGSLTCAVNPSSMKEGDYGLEKALTKRKIVVVGGGAAGMEAALVSAERGHDVTLIEKSGRLGGRLYDAGVHSFKISIRQLAEWFEYSLAERGVTVLLNTEATPKTLKESGADAVIFATGADPLMPKAIEGIDSRKAVSCTDVLEGKREPGDRIVIVGAGLVGAEMAYDYAKEGKKVYLVDALGDILANDADGVPFQTRMMLNRLLDYHGVTKLLGYRLKKIDETGAVVTDEYGHDTALEADDVIIAVGFRKRPSMLRELDGEGIETYEIVAGNAIGSIATQVSDAYEIARCL